jgi:anti-anti-sigma factor
MASNMQIKVLQEQGRVPVTVFQVEGNIDIASYEELKARAEEAYESGTRNLLLDLAKVKYVSSLGLRTFHDIFSLLRDTAVENDETMKQGLRDGSYKSAHFKLLNPSRDVATVLKVSGFDMFLEIHTDRQKALASF